MIRALPLAPRKGERTLVRTVVETLSSAPFSRALSPSEKENGNQPDFGWMKY